MCMLIRACRSVRKSVRLQAPTSTGGFRMESIQIAFSFCPTSHVCTKVYCCIALSMKCFDTLTSQELYVHTLATVGHGIQLQSELTDNRQHQNDTQNSRSDGIFIRSRVLISDHVSPSRILVGTKSNSKESVSPDNYMLLTNANSWIPSAIQLQLTLKHGINNERYSHWKHDDAIYFRSWIFIFRKS